MHNLPMDNHANKLDDKYKKEKDNEHQSNDVNFEDIFSLLFI